jgi:hypothetical protein
MSIRQVLILSALLLAASAAHAADRKFEQRVNADPKGSVRVSNVAGKVNVVGWKATSSESTCSATKGARRSA